MYSLQSDSDADKFDFFVMKAILDNVDEEIVETASGNQLEKGPASQETLVAHETLKKSGTCKFFDKAELEQSIERQEKLMLKNKF